MATIDFGGDGFYDGGGSGGADGSCVCAVVVV